MASKATEDANPDKVRVEVRADLIEMYEDGSALVNADGVEMLVEEDEWR